MVCCAFAGIAGYTQPQPITEVVAETTSATRMNIQSGEFVWNSTTGIRTMNADSYTAGVDGYVGNDGLDLITGTKYPTTASVLHCPETAIGTYTISLSNTYFRRYSGASKMRFRIVKNNEIVYPADGGWAACGAVNEEIKATGSLTMKAGDDLYFIANDEAVKGNGAAIWVQAGMTINGVWFDATVANHVNSANDSKTTSSYFDGTYTYAELFTYEYISSWYDYEEVDNSGFGNYQKRTVADSTQFTTATTNALWPAYNVDMRGAEYYAFTIDNSAGTQALSFSSIIYEGHPTKNIGSSWTIASYNEYYLLNEQGVLQKFDATSSGSYNIGKVTVPMGFKGQVLLPLTSYEIVSWQLPSAHTDRFGKYGEANVMYLKETYRTDLQLLTTPESTVTVTDVQFWGSDLLTTYVSDNYKTAIQAIDNIGAVTAASANQIIKAQNLYNKLSDENKAKVSNYETLKAALETYKNLPDYSGYVGTNGKDFTGLDGVAFNDVVSESPSSISAWIKVGKDVADDTHVGTIVGNMERVGSNAVTDSYTTMSMEITTNGRPKFVWRKSSTAKINFVVEGVDVRTGHWLNITFIRDTVNNQIDCYINGVKVASKAVDAADIADINFVNKPFMVGSDYTNDPITAPGCTPDFNGCIANVKLYSGILTDGEVISNLKTKVADKGLMNDLTFRSGDDGAYYDSAANEEIEESSVWIENGAEQLKLGDYSFAILGDTQMMLSMAKDANGNSLYSPDYDYTSNVFYKNTQWLIANKDNLNLQFVMHVGDISDSGNTSNKITASLGSAYTYKYEQEFAYAIDWMNSLREAEIPYAMARGNHETVELYEKYYTAEANKQYVTSDVTTTAEDGTETTVTAMYSSSSMRNVAYTLNVGNQKYLIVVIDYEPTNDELAWANAVVAAHPTHRTIILTHKYMKGTNARYTSADIGTNYGESIWNNLVSQHANIVMLVSGHASSTSVGRRVDTGVNGNKVLQLMVDESLIEYSGTRQTGVMALLGFENGGNTVHFNFYSPSEDKLYRADNQFTVELDSSFFNDADEKDVTEYAKQEDLPLDAMPNFGAYYAYGTTNGYQTGSNTNTCSSFSRSGFTLRTGHLLAVKLHMSADGIFYFDPASYLNGRNTSTLRLEVFVSNENGITRRAYPAKDEYANLGKGKWYLNQVGGIEVNAGDTVTVAFATLDNPKYCYGRFDGYIADKISGDKLVSYVLKAGYGDCAWTDCTAINDGTKTDYSVGWIATTSYTLTVQDMEGNTVQTLSAGKNGEYVLPKLQRTGHVFVGYIVDGTLLPVGGTIQVTAAKTITAAFVEFSMFNGASVRINEPTGIRFSTQMDIGQYNTLVGANATISFGTLIAMASDITVEGAIDYSLLTRECGVKKLDVVSTVQHTNDMYLQFNGAVVGIKENNINKQFAARSYMQITYANGETVVLYANVRDNARSVAEVAALALADVSALETNEYKYANNGVYGLFDENALSVLQGFIS